MSFKTLRERPVWSWCLYDWANSAFATTVMAGFFPIFLKQYWSAGTDPTESTFQLGMANAVAGLIVAAMAPVLGAIADRGGRRKKFLMLFTVLGVLMTAGLALVGKGDWPMAIALFTMGTVGFTAGVVFYDALIMDVTDRRRWDFVSGAGYAYGYLGGGILFAVNVWMTLQPQVFGLADAAEAVKVSFVMVAIWWAIFAIPLFLFVEERPAPRPMGLLQATREGWAQFLQTFRHVRELRVVFLFLLAYWFYIDGVNTVIKMAVDYGLSLGFESSDLIVALLLVQFVGFPAALAFGYLGEKWGSKKGIYLGIGVYTAVTVWAFYLDTVIEFYMMAVAIGLVQGGVQSLSRSYYARLIPADKSAEFFGFYGMLGKFATIIGPFLMGWVGVLTGSPRYAILSIAVLFVIGVVLLMKVDESEAPAYTAADR
ncbi:MAG: MFS transporter [Gammaproteobacteria bacterium]|nr:MFS transporter [Gammaproteobacteria bacterium]